MHIVKRSIFENICNLIKYKYRTTVINTNNSIMNERKNGSSPWAYDRLGNNKISNTRYECILIFTYLVPRQNHLEFANIIYQIHVLGFLSTVNNPQPFDDFVFLLSSTRLDALLSSSIRCRSRNGFGLAADCSLRQTGRVCLISFFLLTLTGASGILIGAAMWMSSAWHWFMVRFRRAGLSSL